MIRPDVVLLTAWSAVLTRLTGGDRRNQPARVTDRGDIPGWVMVTIMSAAIIVVLIPFVGPVIAKAFSNAVDNVTNTPSVTTK